MGRVGKIDRPDNLRLWKGRRQAHLGGDYGSPIDETRRDTRVLIDERRRRIAIRRLLLVAAVLCVCGVRTDAADDVCQGIDPIGGGVGAGGYQFS